MSQLPKYSPQKRASPAANVLLTILLLVAVAVVVYYAYFAPQPPKVISQIPFLRPNETAVRDAAAAKLDEKYRLNTLEYYDQNYSFSIRYPIGYNAIVDPTLDVRLRFSAYYPPFSAEIFDVRVIDKDVLDAEKIRASAVEANTTATTYIQDGKGLHVVSMRQQNPVDENDVIFVKQAYYECPNYWLVFVAAVSAPLAPDLELADYMVSTMRCQQ